MKHLVIGQRQKAPNFLAFHWPPHGSLVFIGQHFGPSTFAVKMKIYGVVYNQSSSIAFDETFIYWSAPKSS